MGDEEYEQYEDLFSNHSLIKSENLFGDNNFYLSKRSVNLMRKNSKILNVNIFKKYYRFFGYQVLMKDTLYKNYLKIKNEFSEDYNFMPETYYYPDDKYIIYEKFRNYTLNINDLWLVKPAHRWGGRGIKILESLDKIEKETYLINKYITNLDLINNKKYDLRLYVLVTGLKPLRIYLNREGLIRIASRNFSLDISNIKERYVHLTNTGVNSKSKEFIIPNNDDSEQANIWNFHTYERYLKKINVDYNKIKYKIRDLIIESWSSVYKNLTMELSENN
jgi:tubulin polyglutamylase TTLL4